VSDVVELVADTSSFTARRRDGQVLRWGRVITGWADGQPIRSLQPPSRVPLPTVARQLAQSHDSACALLADGRVSCWGHRNGSDSVEPSIIGNLPPVAELGLAGRYADHFCGRAISDGFADVYCWGRNDYYQLGSGNNDVADGAVRVSVGVVETPRQLP
jgi:alpha-tubulin suppressor-like RCC1 family protein